jgi:nucleotide-binding universal stress UspA family protein
VLFAYDGSEMAKTAIAEASRQLPRGRDAVILTVWRTFSVGFIPENGAQFDAACADDVGNAAAQTAAAGVSLADSAGFRAEPLAVQGTPAWKAILDTADEHDASLIVLGSHRHAGLGGRVAGSIAADVATRSDRPVLIVHPDSKGDGRADGRKPTGAHAGASPGALLVGLGLDPVQLAVLPAMIQQLVVRAHLGDARPVEHHDEVGHPHGAEPV